MANWQESNRTDSEYLSQLEKEYSELNSGKEITEPPPMEVTGLKSGFEEMLTMKPEEKPQSSDFIKNVEKEGAEIPGDKEPQPDSSPDERPSQQPGDNPPAKKPEDKPKDNTAFKSNSVTGKMQIAFADQINASLCAILSDSERERFKIPDSEKQELLDMWEMIPVEDRPTITDNPATMFYLSAGFVFGGGILKAGVTGYKKFREGTHTIANDMGLSKGKQLHLPHLDKSGAKDMHVVHRKEQEPQPEKSEPERARPEPEIPFPAENSEKLPVEKFIKSDKLLTLKFSKNSEFNRKNFDSEGDFYTKTKGGKYQKLADRKDKVSQAVRVLVAKGYTNIEIKKIVAAYFERVNATA